MLLRKRYPRKGQLVWSEHDVDRLISRLGVECPHFQNYGFRVAVQEGVVCSGMLEALQQGFIETEEGKAFFGGGGGTLRTTARFSRPRLTSGAACAGRRVPSLELRREPALDTAAWLQAGSPTLPSCNKIGLIFAVHPPSAPTNNVGITREETELMWRTTFCQAFLNTEGDSMSCVTVRNLGKYLAAGEPECLVVENVWLLRHSADQYPGDWRREARDFGIACGFLPTASPRVTCATADPLCRYEDERDRLRYRAQVQAAVEACCLLDCDALVIGCADGICGSELFGHPITECAEVWKEVLTPLLPQFKRVTFGLHMPMGATAPKEGTYTVLANMFGLE